MVEVELPPEINTVEMNEKKLYGLKDYESLERVSQNKKIEKKLTAECKNDRKSKTCHRNHIIFFEKGTSPGNLTIDIMSPYYLMY